ncbi:MAG TPA: hypothetical protein DCE28_03930 [Halomonas sp.]|nr:hypothetical protein [Halomonas sp.]
MEIPGELLQVSCGITATHRVLAKQLKHAECSLEVLARHYAAQPFQFRQCRAIATKPDGFSKLLHIIHSELKWARADPVQPFTCEGNCHN